MWVIDLLVNFRSPHLEAPARLSTSEMLWSKECAPSPSPFVVFTFGLAVESIKELGGTSPVRRKKHENNSCASFSSCMRGVETKGKDDNDFCDCHRLLFFKGVMARRKKKDTKKRRDPLERALASSYLKKPWKNKTWVLFLPLNVALKLCSSNVPQLSTPLLKRSIALHSSSAPGMLGVKWRKWI